MNVLKVVALVLFIVAFLVDLTGVIGHWGAFVAAGLACWVGSEMT